MAKIIGDHTNTENERLTIREQEVGAFAGQFILGMYQCEIPLALMLLDEGTMEFLIKALWQIHPSPETLVEGEGTMKPERTGSDALRDAAEADRAYQAQQDAGERAGEEQQP